MHLLNKCLIDKRKRNLENKDKHQIAKTKDVKKLNGTTNSVKININGIKIISPELELFDNATSGNNIPNKYA